MCELDLDLWHFYVDQTFVQSHLDKDVSFTNPKGCGNLPGQVVQLNKSLYGLKQASRTWHSHLKRCLEKLGFEQCKADVIENGRVSMIFLL